mmetsp:Transcript_29754/g.50845  ORF Transcript_29754/g.50845 Transcript_29754/m.50845 type:complete len:104 (+) Transcript_29754:54-365(+)
MSTVFRLLLLAIALVQSAALRVAVAPAPAALATRASLRMAMPTIEDARTLSDAEIEQEIFNAKKELFELRKQVKTRQPVKPHLFTHTKHRIGQLQTLLSQRQA